MIAWILTVIVVFSDGLVMSDQAYPIESKAACMEMAGDLMKSMQRSLSSKGLSGEITVTCDPMRET